MQNAGQFATSCSMVKMYPLAAILHLIVKYLDSIFIPESKHSLIKAIITPGVPESVPVWKKLKKLGQRAISLIY
jgi:hypothetical protein